MARDEINAFLGTGTTYQGRLDFQGSVRIDGTFKGEVASQGTLVIGKDANVDGTVNVGQLIISGRLQGEIVAKDKVILHKTANVVGSLSTPVLVIEEGAVLEGQITMGGKGAKKASAPLPGAASATASGDSENSNKPTQPAPKTGLFR
ncbi:polymer-forming cytoskeletal protein [Desulfocurvus sp.]|jgi:cytoskeletal protein CcmA (bactofilin family)|uniref:bactofilin family protein n=1 Tax=Desulfocurvus sp. TaxID=2871698 RepID=UPI0025B866F5|nr:polymer-forming cytoskeletal protein [Desulfocurvus sp.]MCK9240175.1 polymer-forming cytoskeletal protein [Desulfocurvus sp.]